MKTDPVCGMTVPDDSENARTFRGADFRFCSSHCLDKFNEDPGSHIGDDYSIDPVCGMRVPAASENRIDHDGTTFRFCGQGCMTKFQADPAAFPARTDAAPPKKTAPANPDATYFCPMCPGQEQQGPGVCKVCGMALEPTGVARPAQKTEYTCPMHPEVVSDQPGNCPKCGMALEPRTVDVEEKNAELIDMSRRFWISTLLAAPVFLLAMTADLAPDRLPTILTLFRVQWIEFILATPVVLWGGWPFFQRFWLSVKTWNLNMFTLIGLGVGVAWTYSVVALLAPGVFPPLMRMARGSPPRG